MVRELSREPIMFQIGLYWEPAELVKHGFRASGRNRKKLLPRLLLKLALPGKWGKHEKNWVLSYFPLLSRGVLSCRRAPDYSSNLCQPKHDLYDFFRGCFGAFYTRKRTGSRPKTPLKKSYRSKFRRAQIR